MKISEGLNPKSPFMGNYFCLLDRSNTAFIAIAKNGVTYLKQLAIYNRTGKIISNEDHIHGIVGYSNKSEYLIEVVKMSDYELRIGQNYFKFAVWRDPVERLISTYKYFCLEKTYREYFRYLGFYNEDISFKRFLEFVNFELRKEDVLLQDEHIRLQCHHYNIEDIDLIVQDKDLNVFLEELGFNLICNKVNQTRTSFRCTDVEIEEVKNMYHQDYKLFDNALNLNKIWSKKK